jgi:adenine specific DNA methylase Mod
MPNYDGVILDSAFAWDTQFWPLPQEQEMPRAARRQEPLFENRLFFGDNLRILRNRAYVERESVDLVYLDPPFNSGRNYNLIFRARGGAPAAAQVRVFEDTWHWSAAAAEAFHDTKENAPQHVARTLEALRTILNENDMFAYLCMMAPRLVELHKALKPTGSIYLHCDPAASHYLKVLMDAVFGVENFRNEIIWKRTGAHSSAHRAGPVHDVILFYTKSDRYTWNRVYVPHNPGYLKSHYTQVEPDGRVWRADNLTAMGVRHGSSGESWRGFDVTAKGNHWKFTIAHLEELDANGRIYWPSRGGWPAYKRYLDEVKGTLLQDVWTDIPPINAKAAERLHYPTQKPLPLLERIIQASTNEGEVVLDPFCGCGTTIEAADNLRRLWLGIDLEYEAIRIIRERLSDGANYKVYGDPESAADAEELAKHDAYQFQWWAVRRLGAREVEEKKGADKGIDGRLILRTERYAEGIISVKAGQTGPAHVRELHGTMTREKAELGVLVTLRPPTAAMKAAAADAGSYTDGDRWYPRLQLITAADIIEGAQVEYPADVALTRRVGAPENVARRE